MADFSASGWEWSGLPVTTLDALERGGDPRVLSWIREAVIEGDRLLRGEANYDQIERGMAYIEGNQLRPDGGSGRPAYLSNLTLNESRRVTQAHTSALTDLKPMFSYRSFNPKFQLHTDLLNKLLLAWWLNTRADIELGDAIKYALAAGTGDMVVEWDPYAPGGGDVRMTARDCRDTLPIRPPTHARHLQAWDGLVIREAHTVNVMAGLYPTMAAAFRPTTDSLLATLMGRFKATVAKLISPAADTLSGLTPAPLASRLRSGDVLLYRTYLTDRTRNLTSRPIPMGTPGASWAYTVPPGGFLYPYKRLIVSTPEVILYDGPNTYWHGLYPVARLKLWSVPWQRLGTALLNDLIPVQDGINDLAQGILLGIKKWLDPAVQYNRNAVSEAFMRTFDPRRPGAKVKLNEQGAREGFKLLDGPAPQVLAIALETMQVLTQKYNDLSGTPNLQELLALRQFPGADTIQQYWEALTPELRNEARQVETFLAEIAEQQKCLRFQYESNAKRVQILGDAGALLEDFDFDPANLIPAMLPGQEGYEPQYDAALPRDVRARAVMRTITFSVTPNSLLAMNSMERKMIALQNFRMGVLDFWSYHEVMETPNVGSPPPIPLPPLDPDRTNLEVQQLLAASAAGDLQAAADFAKRFSIDPTTGQVLELRIPMTITERLLAQNMLGLGTAVSPASGEGPPQASGGGGGGNARESGRGRPASGQAPPKMEQKSDGRTTVTESRHGSGS